MFFDEAFLEQTLGRSPPAWQELVQLRGLEAITTGVDQGLKQLGLSWRTLCD